MTTAPGGYVFLPTCAGVGAELGERGAPLGETREERSRYRRARVDLEGGQCGAPPGYGLPAAARSERQEVEQQQSHRWLRGASSNPNTR